MLVVNPSFKFNGQSFVAARALQLGDDFYDLSLEITPALHDVKTVLDKLNQQAQRVFASAQGAFALLKELASPETFVIQQGRSRAEVHGNSQLAVEQDTVNRVFTLLRTVHALLFPVIQSTPPQIQGKKTLPVPTQSKTDSSGCFDISPPPSTFLSWRPLERELHQTAQHFAKACSDEGVRAMADKPLNVWHREAIFQRFLKDIEQDSLSTDREMAKLFRALMKKAFEVTQRFVTYDSLRRLDANSDLARFWSQKGYAQRDFLALNTTLMVLHLTLQPKINKVESSAGQKLFKFLITFK